MEQSPSQEANNHTASQKIPLPFTETGSSLLCSQEPVCHCFLSWAKWMQSTSSHPISPRYIIILSSQLCQVVSSLQVSQPEFCIHLPSFPFMLH